MNLFDRADPSSPGTLYIVHRTLHAPREIRLKIVYACPFPGQLEDSILEAVSIWINGCIQTDNERPFSLL